MLNSKIQQNVTAVVMAGVLIGCQTMSGLNTPEALEAKKLISQAIDTCDIGYTELDEKYIVVFKIDYGEDSWIRVDAATRGLRGDVYYNKVKQELYCGESKWMKSGNRFTKIQAAATPKSPVASPSESPSAGSRTTGSDDSLEQRINKLRMLRKQELITEAEYASKVGEIAGGAGDDSIAGRLSRLAALQTAGLLSAEEFAAKRREILSTISPAAMEPAEGLALLKGLLAKGTISQTEATPLRKAFMDAL